MPPLPGPRATLAGAVWLLRILEKARRLQRGVLPREYAARFGAANGTDGQFLGFFDLTAGQLLSICGENNDLVSHWFLSQPGIDETRIAAWNELAVNLGRPGFPMAERLPVALTTTYANLRPGLYQTVFEVIEADEGLR